MVQQKTGWPEEGELVIATVTKIQYHSVFCNLDEYSRSGMMHISEIAPGRIKNINEYVREGKTLVLKVLRIDKDKGHIDLSLRRVTEAQRRQKAAELKQQHIVENVLRQLSEKGYGEQETLKKIETALLEEYHTLFDAFQEVVEKRLDLSTVLDKKLAKDLTALLKERLKPKTVSIKGEFSIESWDSEGVLHIRTVFEHVPQTATVSYAGGGRYTVIIEDKNYKQAEETLKGLQDHVKASIPNATVSFARTDKK